MSNNKKILVIGAGYVGLTSSVCFAKLGHQVTAYDLNLERIQKLQSGKAPIFEPGLDSLILEGQSNGNLVFVSNPTEAAAAADFVFLCVPTPQDQDGSADLSAVLNAAGSIAKLLRPGAIVVTKSTVPVGSAHRIKEALGRRDVEVASNPEFLREGTAIEDFMNPDRIVVGADEAKVAEHVGSLYESINSPKLLTSLASSELIKYASNSFLALKLSFANEIAGLCERVSADMTQVSVGMGLDSRIGAKFLTPGPGWGGSCFPKDSKALSSIFEQNGLTSPLILASLESNEKAKRRVVEAIARAADGALEGKRVAVWGLAFKANTDDTRESPAVSIITRLIDRGARVVAYDPEVKALNLEGLAIAGSAIEAARDADVLAVLTEWPEFGVVDALATMQIMRSKCVVDARRVLDASLWKPLSSHFFVIGETS